MCARVFMCLFSQCVNKIKTPDKALIITEEQGYVDKEVLVCFLFCQREKNGFGDAELDPSMIGVGFFF